MKFTVACIACLLLPAATFCAESSDPFLGKWLLNEKRSVLPPQYEEIQALGNNRFKLIQGLNDDSFVFTADGSEQKVGDLLLSVTPEKANSWKVTWKKGNQHGESIYAVSPDSKILTIDYVAPDKNGQTVRKQFKRVSETSGLVGKWKQTDHLSDDFGHAFEIVTHDGVMEVREEGRPTFRYIFDGKYHVTQSDPRWSTRCRRINAHEIELTSKERGKPEFTSKQTVSADAKTYTSFFSPYTPGSLVYDRVESFPRCV